MQNANALSALRLGAPHGLKGDLRAVVMLAAPQIIVGQALATQTGAGTPGPELTVTALKLQPGGYALVKLAGVLDRTAAEALTGLTLLFPRDRLPAIAAGEIYLGDLLARTVVDATGAVQGKVTALHTAAEQDLLEITLSEGGKKLVPANAEFFADLHATPLVLSELGQQLIEL